MINRSSTNKDTTSDRPKTDEPATKQCPECFSTIDARAKTCPHCQTKIMRNDTLYSINLLVGMTGLLTLIVGVLMGSVAIIIIGVVVLLVAYKFRQ